MGAGKAVGGGRRHLAWGGGSRGGCPGGVLGVSWGRVSSRPGRVLGGGGFKQHEQYVQRFGGRAGWPFGNQEAGGVAREGPARNDVVCVPSCPLGNGRTAGCEQGDEWSALPVSNTDGPLHRGGNGGCLARVKGTGASREATEVPGRVWMVGRC